MRRKTPRQQMPDMIRVEYYKSILPRAEKMISHARSVIVPELAAIVAHTERADATNIDPMRNKSAKRLADKVIKEASARAVDLFSAADLRGIADKFGNRTSKFQKSQLVRQAQSAIALDLGTIGKVEKGIVGLVDEWIAVNVDLIKSLPDRYFDDIKTRVYQAIDAGTRHEDLANDLAGRYEIPIEQAKLIARDQVGKLYGSLNGQRQQNLGITGYFWRGVLDNRERAEHEDREGQRFTWDDPPDDGHPGEPVQCRCYAEPDFTDLFEEN